MRVRLTRAILPVIDLSMPQAYSMYITLIYPAESTQTYDTVCHRLGYPGGLVFTQFFLFKSKLL
jgi:hypothetical protein